MDKTEAYEFLVREYLYKCKEYGCSSCIAECYCTSHGLKKSWLPQEDCPEKLKAYLKHTPKESKRYTYEYRS